MPIFQGLMLIGLQAQIRTLAIRFFGVHQLVLLSDEFVSAYINPDHIKTLRETESLCGRIGPTASIMSTAITSNGKMIRLYLNFRSSAPIIMPDYIRSGIQPTAPVDVAQKIQEWVDMRWEYGCKFGDAYDALDYLNVVCADARDMAVMFPILSTLMRNTTDDAESRNAKRAKKLADPKGCGTLPSLPRDIVYRIQELSSFLLAVNMLDVPKQAVTSTGDAEVSFYQGYDTIKREPMFKGLPGIIGHGTFL